jgi:hypothetical protein
LAVAPGVSPSLTRLTANPLNSAVYSCFGIFFIVFLSKVTLILRHHWKIVFRGTLSIERGFMGLVVMMDMLLYNSRLTLLDCPKRYELRHNRAA